MKGVLFMLMCACAATSLGVNVLVDYGAAWAGGQAGNQATITFLDAFADTTVTWGEYSDTTNAGVQAAIAAADVLVLTRTTYSGAYDAADGAYYSGLKIPVIFLTSYVTRSSKIAFEGGLNAGAAVDGAETTVTADGAAVLGVAAGTYDFYTAGFDTLGTGSVGTGKILATIGGNNLAVLWSVGDTDGSGRTQAGKRLLYNIHTNGNTLPDTAAGLQAFQNAVGTILIPEPATMVLMGLGALTLLRKRK